MTTTRTLDRTRPPAAGHCRPPGFVARWRARRAERDAWAAHHRFAQGVTAEFREACTALRLCQYVSVAAGIAVRTPRVGAVHGGPPVTLTVELMAGQEPADFTSKENGPRIAHSLGGHGLRVGSKQLTALSVRDVRLMVEKLRKAGVTPRTVQWIHSTLRAALQHAFREELVTRNVARGVKIATPAAGTTPPPFSPDEARPFLSAVADHRLYALWVVRLDSQREALGLLDDQLGTPTDDQPEE